jgi:hypothetical protein
MVDSEIKIYKGYGVDARRTENKYGCGLWDKCETLWDKCETLKLGNKCEPDGIP